MILLGTSGSTKCDWQLIKEGDIVSKFTSKGINPFFHDKETIAENILAIEELTPYLDEIDVVFFYGTGCATIELKNIVQRGLSSVFKRSNYYINHDIVAAAFATYEGVPNFTGLIGTGSSSCFFDGDVVRQEAQAIDYILGDEGSGAYFGKQLLSAYLRNKLPKEISSDFDDTFKLSRHEILENVYLTPYPNVYLASFISFIEERKSHPYFDLMVANGLALYLDLNICSFNNYKKYKTHFVGSIPYNFEDILRKVAAERSIEIGTIIKEPIDKLVEYHINKYYITKDEKGHARN